MLRALSLMVGVYLIGRGIVEVAIVDPGRRETYRNDWGGPHYLGVLLIHVGPGAVAAVLLVRWWRHRRRGAAATRSRSDVDLAAR